MARVGDLQIFAGESEGPLPPNSTRYKIIEASIHLALCILETSQGRRSLVETARAIITASREQGRDSLYRDSLDNLASWINKFLVRVREDFFTVFIRDIGGEALAERLEWPGEYNMADYEAGPVGNLSLNRVLVENMIHAHQRPPPEAYARFKFQLSISIAHEVVHFLTGFLLGSPRSNTPRGVTLQGWGNMRTGEAGRYWEAALLGGVVEFRSDRNDTLGVRQAGTPYLFPNGRHDTPGRRISLSYITEFVDGVFSFPVRVVDGDAEATRRDLNSNSVDTTDLRSGHRRRGLEPTESPPPGHPSSQMRYRMPSSGSEGYYVRSSQSTSSQAGGSGRGYASQSGRPSQANNPPAGGSGRGYASQSSRPSQAYPPAAGGSGRAYNSQVVEPIRSSNPQSTRSDRSYPNPFAPRSSAPSQPSYTQPTSGSRPPEYYYRR
ncbi:Hypothetical protein NCS54_00426800 [Fusarium falciforme]|uniref:Hypothetical protein n=1 Tax=Fusarium falciforme TaxID=195108 RepID=UPI002300BDEB|nr:Hypothetical protein NCS54_00426800 [Fusarium falciforme]WAO86976.1 Hypothetical protein NCS54_00426800 [Fusarium falciforme]